MTKSINLIGIVSINGGPAVGVMTAAGNPWSVPAGVADELVNRGEAQYVVTPVANNYGSALWSDSAGTTLIKPDGTITVLGAGAGPSSPGGASVAVVNDLTTGGTTAALSAQQGVTLKAAADALAQTVINNTAALAAKAPSAGATLTNATLAGTTAAPTVAVGDNTTSIATTAFAQALVANAVTGLLHLQSSINASASPSYPPAAKGDAYLFSVAGFIGGAGGKAVNIGDLAIAILANAGGVETAVGTSWIVLEHAIAGATLGTNNLSDLSNIATAWANLGGAARSQAAAQLLTLGQFTQTGAVAGQVWTATSPTAASFQTPAASGTATPVVNNLTTGGATSALSAQQGVVLANANPDPFVGMTSDQIRAAPANGIAYFGTYNSVNAAAAHVVAKDQGFTWTPAAANAAWVAAGNTAPVTPTLTGKIWYDSIGKIILVSAWA